MSDTVFPLTLLHRPLYVVFRHHEGDEMGKDILGAAVEAELLWVIEGETAEAEERLRAERPDLFSEYDEYGDARNGLPPARTSAWTATTISVPPSFGPSPRLRWSAVRQEALDVAAGKVRGRTAQDIAAVKRLIEEWLADPSGEHWHAYGAGERVGVPEASRLFLWVEGDGKVWHNARGATWAEASGVWRIPG